MGVVKCPDCGKEVSDRSNVCIHCGAPLNFSANGKVLLKCKYLNGSLMKAKVVNTETGEEIANLRQGEVISLQIKKDTPIEISLLMMKSTTGVLKYLGSHNYEINATPGFFMPKLVLNEVTNIDSD